MGFFDDMFGSVDGLAEGGRKRMPTVEENYDYVNSYVKKVEHSVSKTRENVKENSSKSLFNISYELSQKNNAINEKYAVSGDVAKETVLEEWTSIAELQKNVRREVVNIDNEAKNIEERFRQMTSL